MASTERIEQASETPVVEGLPLSELRRLVAEDKERWATLGDHWDNMTVAEQEALVAHAAEVAGRER